MTNKGQIFDLAPTIFDLAPTNRGGGKTEKRGREKTKG
jgi:hypothetical protein